ncbi:titin isoform X5 [Ochlerotatus camptorhynchus]|uniref:titin isoform X5 n=1 Tax=Ochlerotatus camptorhynchus TaxID=644619 RepID=UPI0031D0A9D8
MEPTGNNGLSPLDELQRQLNEDLAQVVAPTPPPLASAPLVATTISTVVVQGGPLQLVIALLKSGERLYIKVADLLPKFTFLGPSLDEALHLQRQHEELLRQIQNLPTPLEEFYHKVQEKIASHERPDPVLIEEMAASLGAVWQDIKKMLQERRDIILLNVTFFERLGECYGKMSSLEVACNDTMIPIEIDAVREFLESFKFLRTEMLSTISAGLKVGNQMLDKLRELANIGTFDSRPNHVKQDALQAVAQVERWLEDLSNRRNNLEQAWQSRKTQLEQCLTLAILAKELSDIEYSLNATKNSNFSSFTLGDSANQARDLLEIYQNVKPEALLLRDKSLKITKTTEELVSTGCFAGDEACAKAYSILACCTEFVDEVDHREALLSQSREFFGRAENLLTKLSQIEIELSNLQLRPSSPSPLLLQNKALQEVTATIEDILQMGYSLIDDVGRTKPEVAGVQAMVERIEQKKASFERYCLQSSEESLRLTEALNDFLERYNQLFQWLEDSRRERIEQAVDIHRMGENLAEAKDCLLLHHQLLNDLEIKGNAINNLLVRLTPVLEYLEDDQRDDVQHKIDVIRQTWIELKNYVNTRVDLLKLYIRFHQEAEILRNLFESFDIQKAAFRSAEHDRPLLQAALDNIRAQLGQLKAFGEQCIDGLEKVADPYLQKARAAQCVDRTLTELNARQLTAADEWERWNAQQHTDATLNDIMAANMETLAAASKLEEQLYPIFNTASDNPADLSAFIATKLSQIQSEIRSAESELTNRFETIDQLDTDGPEGSEKVIQVKNSLNSIKTKLHTIAADFQELASAVDRFLRSVLTCRDNIKDYFANKQPISGPDNVESITNSYEQFKQNTMEYFRNLLQQSEQIIERIKAQEPPGAKEQDTDKIITLLENLRTYFETQTESENSELRKQHAVIAFDRSLNEVRGEIREKLEQVNRGRGQYGENADGARHNLAALDDFERGLTDLESKIESFVSSSQSLSSQYPETAQYVHTEATKIRNEWAELFNTIQEYRKLTTIAIQYYELITVVENNYRNLNADLINANNKLSILNNPDIANDLIQQIDNILKVYETQQLDTLKQISTLSSQIYGHDSSVVLYNDNLKLFQSFYKIKNDLNDRAKELTEQQLQQQQQQETQQNGYHEVTTITSTTSHNGLPQQQSFEVQTVDESQYFQEPQSPLVIQTVEESRHEQIHEIVTATEPPPSLSVPQPLRDVSVREGQRAQLQCVIIGHPTPAIEWFKDGISIHNNPDYKTTFDGGLCTLTIDETVTADTAEYLCRAINDAGIADSPARLIVTELPQPVKPQGVPPVFTQKLENGTATEGQPFQYLCTVSGNPQPPEVHWFKNDTCINGSSDYRISYDPTTGEAALRFEQVFLEDQARYSCRASNECGSDETTAQLAVEPLEPTEYPSFRVPPSNVMARVGQKIKLEAEVAGTPPPEVMWTHDGKHFSNREVKFFYENGRAQLVIDEAFLKDAGVYTLTAKNIAGEKSCSCNVVVKGRLPNETSDSELASDMEPVKPSVQLQLKDVSVFEGKPVRLDCVIVGQPEPEVIWYHGDRPVKESTDFQLLFQGDHCSLVIREAFLEDAGEYRVVAINSAGEASSKCNLIVTPLNIAEPAVRQPTERVLPPLGAPPKFERLLADILAADGEKCQFECAVSGDPRPNVKWFVNNREIEENPRVHSVYRDDGVVKLVIEQVFPDDKGVYTAKASNPSGEAKCFSNLIVKSINATEFESVPAFLSDSVVCPTFKELFADRIVKLHESTKFECIVVGKPQPKIKWFFNDQPVHGHDFLVSTSGDRQVLTIPEISPELAGKITCYAENEAGNAQCVAYVKLADVYGAMLPMQPLITAESMLQVDNSGSSFVTLQKQVTTSSSSYSSSMLVENGVSQSEVHSQSAHMDRSFKQVGDQAPEVAETKQFAQFHQANDQPPSFQQETSMLNIANNNASEMHETIIANSGQISTGKPARRSSAPRFVSPFNGKIVDQGADVVFEGIIDGYPTAEVKVTKNDVELQPDGERITVSYSLNKIVVELKNVSTKDAGRYTATASNAAGASSTTADLVVKKSIFPPVFGRRVQAQSVRRGDRVILDAEISGTPEPIVAWFKDNRPVQEALRQGSYALQQVGPTCKLIFEQIDYPDSGKYMIVARNTGGEAQSIADVVVMEAEQPQPAQQPQKHVSFVEPQPMQSSFFSQQQLQQQQQQQLQQQQQQQQQMYSSFTTTHQLQASNLSQQQYSQSMQYQPYKPSEPLPAPQPTMQAPVFTPLPQPTPQPFKPAAPMQTFAPAPAPQPTPQPFKPAAPMQTFAPAPAPAPEPFYAPAPQPFKPAAPLQTFAPAPAPASEPQFIPVHHSLAAATGPTLYSGPSYNQTPQPFKPLPPPSITPSQQNYTSTPLEFPPVQQTFIPAPAPAPVPQFTPAPAPVPMPQFEPAPAPIPQPTLYQEPLYQPHPMQLQLQPEPQFFPQQQQQQPMQQHHSEFVHQQQLQQYHYQQQHMEEEVYKKKSVKETKQLFEQTIQQQDFKSPRMFAQVAAQSPTRPMTLPPDFGYSPAEIGLEPGPQPTMGYAPKLSNERKSSYYREKIEQSLFESMDKVPERVPAGGVKIIPPSPRKKSQTPGQSDTAGMPPASFEQPSEAKGTPTVAPAKSPFTATESECESDLDVTRKMNGVSSGYLADTEEVQKQTMQTVSFSSSSEQKVESFSSSSKTESVVLGSSAEVVQQEEHKVESIEATKVEKVEDAAPTVTAEIAATEVQPEQQQQEPQQQEQQQQEQQQQEQQVSEQVVAETTTTTTTTTSSSSTEEVTKEPIKVQEEGPRNFLANDDLPDDMQPVKVLPTEEPLPTLKHVPVPAAVQPVTEPEHVPLVQELPPQLVVEPAAALPVVTPQQNGYPSASEYGNDFDQKITPAWQPTQTDVGYKSVHPVFNAPKPHETGPAAPPPSVFDPIDKVQTTTLQQPQQFIDRIEKPKPISYTQSTTTQQQQSESSSFQSYQQQSFQQQQEQQHHVSFPPVETAPALYYTSVTAQPVHSTIASETSNTMHMKETTETSNRVVNMSQSQQVVNLESANQFMAQNAGRFTPGEYRESDYESDGSRIRPLWTPHPSDSDEPHFRSVRPQFKQPRSASVPRSGEHIQTPMEFDTGPVLMPSKIVTTVESTNQQQSQTVETVEVLQTQTLDRKSSFSSKRLATSHVSNLRDDMAVKAHKVAPINYIQKATNQAESMSQSFKTKAYHFTNEVMTDMRKAPIKPILKNAFGYQVPVVQAAPPAPTATTPTPTADSNAQAYREESRVSQYGTKHVDPDTGIIYFKYDFGYEFGIIFPGEGHRIIAGASRNRNQKLLTNGAGGDRQKHPLYQSASPFGRSGATSVEVPVIHERTKDYYRNCSPTPFRRSASVPAPDMQASRYQQRYNYPVPAGTGTQQGGSGRSTPRVGYFRPLSRCTTPDQQSTPVQGYNRSATCTPKPHPQEPAIATKLPLFVAPLKDIAVVSGQPARFECIVACDATPAIRWTKNNVPIDESGQRYYPEYRNGLCRLSLPVAYEGDAGNYSCLAENHLGHNQTCADLIVIDSDWRTASVVTDF